MAKLIGGTRIYGTATVDTILYVNGTTAASSTNTGALQIAGGVGVGGAMYVGGPLYVNGVLADTGNTFTNISITGTNVTVSTTTGALTVTGGVGVGGSMFVGGVVTATTFIGALTGTASTASAAAIAYSLGNTSTTRVGYADTATNWLGGTVANASTFNNGIVLASSANNPLAINGNYTAVVPSLISATGGLIGNTQTTAIYALNYQHSIAPVSTTTIANYYGQLFLPTLQNTATYGTMYGAFARIDMGPGATSGTVTSWVGFYSETPSRNAAADVRFTNHYGFRAADPTSITATNVFGFYSSIASGTGKYSIYSAGTAQNRFAGNVGIAKDPTVALDVSGNVLISGITTVTNTTVSTTTATGALQVYGGVGIGGVINVGGTAGTTTSTFKSDLDVLSTTSATSTTTGALQVVGGAGIGGNIYTGGEIHMTSSTTSVFYMKYNTTAGSVDFIFG